MTPEEIEHEIQNLARNGDGADKRWALAKLSAKVEDEVIIPPPIDDVGVISRMTRLMRGAGITNTKAAFVKAFEHVPAAKIKQTPMASEVELDIDVEDLPKTLKQYYNRYPETKKHGFPSGYPLRDPVKQMAWVRKESVLREREKAAANAALIISTMNDLPTDGTIAEATG